MNEKNIYKREGRERIQFTDEKRRVKDREEEKKRVKRREKEREGGKRMRE